MILDSWITAAACPEKGEAFANVKFRYVPITRYCPRGKVLLYANWVRYGFYVSSTVVPEAPIAPSGLQTPVKLHLTRRLSA